MTFLSLKKRKESQVASTGVYEVALSFKDDLMLKY